MPTAIRNSSSFTQDDGTVEIVTPSYHDSALQVSFTTDSTVGTVAIYAKYHPDADAEMVYDEDGNTLVIDLTSPRTFQLYDKWIYSIQFVPTGVDASYTPLLASGEFYRSRRS